ncbi:uncharacterized protein IL334_000088 [Kwoniella shivajii]|uniref:DH domain-containing protein n=1 Tax=Kwoniella shivajii TaxID=564305 RepID=A0ABZ1CPQ0_9TREE|nr:hypothetical protein IL334_000088 [Kwoniella shivajii]
MDSLIVTHPSTLVVSNLEPIPQSVAPTPSLRESPPTQAGPSNLNTDDNHEIHLPSPSEFAGSSRRSSTSSYYPIPGSYFPQSQPGNSKTYYAASSGTNTPSERERPRPSPLNIPAGTPDEPLFSAYPDTGPSKPDSKGKGKAFHLPLKPSFTLGNAPLGRRRRGEEAEESSADEWKMPLSIPSSRQFRQHLDHDNLNSQYQTYQPPQDHSTRQKHRTLPRHGRKRAATVSTSPTEMEPGEGHRKSASTSATEDQQSHSPTRILRLNSVPRPKSLRGFRKRRASLGSAPPVETEYELPGSAYNWKNMPEHVAQKFDSPPLPFHYQQPGNSDYTLRSVSTVTTVRPFGDQIITSGPAPIISARRSSLSTNEPPTLLGLTNINDITPKAVTDIVIPEDMVMPHDPPPRQSSLDYDENVVVEIRARLDSDGNIADYNESYPLSASLTNTDTSTSVSATAFSPSASSKEHPLSSATTSLSRSAKSGKEGEEVKDPSLSAVKLQRSLEWEAKQKRHRHRLAKTRMIILELVETEVAYTEDLKTLCHVYLPQLAALPSVNERNAKMIARNTDELLVFHAAFASKMVDVLKEEGLGYEFKQDDEVESAGKVERASRKLASLFVDDITHFGLYREYCAESIIATTLVRHISDRVDYEGFEKRCQIIGAAQPFTTLKDLLDESGSSGSHNRSRLHFKDYLITPIQRICRYPLLLGQLLDAAGPTSPEAEQEYSEEGYDVGVDIERALGAMRGVAEEADEARRLKDAEVKSATVLERLDPHPNLTPSFIRSLGTCRLMGSLDVLHHHPTVAPLHPPVKVKYLAAFLYRGYLILAKVKKGKTYEAKHFLPLEVFELIDVTEGFLPHSIRLTLREHNFDLAASCEAEKEIWAAAISQARDESVIPPFELPASVSAFPVRARRVSTAILGDFDATTAATSQAPTNRYSVSGIPSELDEMTATAGDISKPATPMVSPIKTTFGFTPERKSGQPSTILLRRASNNQRMLVERGLNDLFSDIISTVRSRAQLQHTLFLPGNSNSMNTSESRDRLSLKDSTMLRRRKSFLDHRTRSTSFDIAITGEIKGSVIELRPSRSIGGNGNTRYRTLPSASSTSLSQQRRRAGSISSIKSGEGDESATATGISMSEFGGVTGGGGGHIPPGGYSRTNSVGSFTYSPMITPRRSLSSLRTYEPDAIMIKSTSRNHSQPPSSISRFPPIPPRSKSFKIEPVGKPKTSLSNSSYNLSSLPSHLIRARSTPASPILSPSPSHENVDTPKTSHALQKSRSDESPNKNTHSRDDQPISPEMSEPNSEGFTTEYFIPPPHGSPSIETIGTNPPYSISRMQSQTRSITKGDMDKPLTNTWGTLRRSMSFLPLRRGNSMTSMSDLGATHRNSTNLEVNLSGSGSGSGSASGTGSEENISNRFSTEKSMIRSTGQDDNDTSNTGDGEGNDMMNTGGWRSAPTTPKRKKSLRLFGLTSRFTPM